MTTAVYVGSELELFADARNWKAYLKRRIEPHLGAEVLEVGAGLGSFTRAAAHGRATRWVCLEPDPGMHEKLARAAEAGGLPAGFEPVLGGMEAVPDSQRFDSVLYVDVLEHIRDDTGEVKRAIARLRPGGRLIVLCPAHQFLYSPFDAGIGHFRRYTRRTLSRLTPEGASLEKVAYLDSAGLLASLANRLLLRKALPTKRQIAFWDRVLVPASRLLDPLLLHRVGKSILAIWRRTSSKPA
jgi:SAM-dependent methyltransferase